MAVRFKRLDKPLGNLSVDEPHPSTDSPRSLSTEIEATLKHSRALATERLGSSLEIPEILAVVLERIRREKDDPSNDGNTPFHVCGCWSTATDRT
jgi:hypothetical protein